MPMLSHQYKKRRYIKTICRPTSCTFFAKKISFKIPFIRKIHWKMYTERLYSYMSVYFIYFGDHIICLCDVEHIKIEEGTRGKPAEKNTFDTKHASMQLYV